MLLKNRFPIKKSKDQNYILTMKKNSRVFIFEDIRIKINLAVDQSDIHLSYFLCAKISSYQGVFTKIFGKLFSLYPS